MKILYLYTEILGYQIAVLKELVKLYEAEIHVVSWDKKRLKPYHPPPLDNVTFYPRSSYNSSRLVLLALSISPDLVYVSGWQDHGYLPTAHRLKSHGKPVVAGFDDQWRGTLRQYLGSIILKFYLKRKYFTHAWVAGPYQYEYAKKMGFRNEEIIYNLLTCDTALFSSASSFLDSKQRNYPKKFLYVGNFRHVKGIDILISAYKIYRNIYGGDWTLTCVGNGPHIGEFTELPGIEVFPFASPELLIDISEQAGAFILPSRHEQWGVVVHEFALAGLPLILSDKVGASPVFLIDGYNGFKYHNDSPDELANRMHQLSCMSTKQLLSMGRNSNRLGSTITSESSAASLASILYSSK